MIVAYIDESGSDNNSKVFAMATILMNHSDSYYFARDWKMLLDSFDVEEFHATDFHGRRKGFKEWDEERSVSFLRQIVELFLKWEIKHSASLVPNADYRQSFVESGFHKKLLPATSHWKKPYLIAFQDTILQLRDAARDQQKQVFITPVFDNCQEFMGQAKEDYREQNRDGRLGNMQVSSAAKDVQIQAVDFIAWEYRTSAQKFLLTGNNNASEALAPLSKHALGNQFWNFETLECLRKRVEAVENGFDPESISKPNFSIDISS